MYYLYVYIIVNVLHRISVTIENHSSTDRNYKGFFLQARPLDNDDSTQSTSAIGQFTEDEDHVTLMDCFGDVEVSTKLKLKIHIFSYIVIFINPFTNYHKEIFSQYFLVILKRMLQNYSWLTLWYE